MYAYKEEQPQLTEDELWKLICRLPLSRRWQQRLDVLFDKIERVFPRPAEKPKS